MCETEGEIEKLIKNEKFANAAAWEPVLARMKLLYATQSGGSDPAEDIKEARKPDLRGKPTLWIDPGNGPRLGRS